MNAEKNFGAGLHFWPAWQVRGGANSISRMKNFRYIHSTDCIRIMRFVQRTPVKKLKNF
jgi:hypothetical protein